MKEIKKPVIMLAAVALISLVLFIICLPKTVPVKSAKGAMPSFKKKILPIDSKQWPKKHDGLFRKYNKRIFGFLLDWRWFKAQGAAESSLRDDPRIVSKAGAKGIMQIMDRTYEMIQKKNKWIAGPITEARWNIAVGILYDKYLWDYWKSERSTLDRVCFMFWSYNCGPSCILNSQKKCISEKGTGGSCNRFDTMNAYVPDEPKRYLKKILNLMGHDQRQS